MGEEGIVIFMVLTIIAGVALMIAAMTNRRKVREMEHRERLAMIDRGLIPSPESNPAGFDAAAGLAAAASDEPDRRNRYRTAGIMLIGFGVGLMFLIGVAGSAPETGVGIGGAWVSLGAASLLNYFLLSRRDEESRAARWSPPPRRPEPPTNIAP
jgi:NADH:ubiquinone oxidoreductase subunit 3 (subunit A)